MTRRKAETLIGKPGGSFHLLSPLIRFGFRLSCAAVTSARHVSCETLTPVSSLTFAAISRRDSAEARTLTMRAIAFCSVSLGTSVPSSAMQ
jgi:hypothetical protein